MMRGARCALAAISLSVASCGDSIDSSAGTPSVSADDSRDDAAGAEWLLVAEGEVVRADRMLRAVTDDVALDDAWSLAGFESGAPDVDLDDWIVVVGTMSFGSGCEPIFAEVSERPDAPDRFELQFVAFEPGHECGADERWYALAVAIDRDLVAPGDTIGLLDRSVALS